MAFVDPALETKERLGLQLRRAEMNDSSSIAFVLHQSFGEYRSLYTPKAFEATISDADKIRARFEEGPIWVALEGNIVVGTVSVVPEAGGLYVRSLAVVPGKRGGGIGRRLLEQVEEFAMEKSFRRLFLRTTPFLQDAFELYSSFGFRRTEEGPYERFGTPIFTMEKILRKIS